MTTIALISEGVTDQAVLETIIETVSSTYDMEEVYPVRIQPRDDASSEHECFAGWERVFDYLNKTQLIDILTFSELLIVHVDADMAEHPRFGVSFRDKDGEKAIDVLMSDIKRKLIEVISLEFFESIKSRVVFAVAVRSVECWLLPCYYSKPPKSERTLNCEDHLIRALNRKNINNYAKTRRFYQQLAAPLADAKGLAKTRSKCLSLDVFVVELCCALQAINEWKLRQSTANIDVSI